MTISTTASKTVAQGNGATTQFPFNFEIPGTTPTDQSNIEVTYTDANGNSTILTNSQFSVTGISTGSAPSTAGIVTYALSGSPIAVGTTLTIARAAPLVQDTSLSNQGIFYPQAIEAALDYLTMTLQQVATGEAFSLQANPADPSAPLPLPPVAQRAGQYLAFDGNGNPVAATGAGSGAPISTVMQPVVAAATLALARTAMGLGAASVENIGAMLKDDGAGNLTLSLGAMVKNDGTGKLTLQLGAGLRNDGANNLMVDSVVGPTAKAANYQILTSDQGALFKATAGIAFTLPGSVAAGAGWACRVGNWSTIAAPQSVTVARSGSDTIDPDAATLIYVLPGEVVEIVADGAGGWMTRGRTIKGRVIRESYFFNSGASTTSTVFASVQTALFAVQPISPASLLDLLFVFDASIANLSSNTNIGSFVLAESGATFSNVYQLSAVTSSTGVGVTAPAGLQYQLANAALAARDFGLQAETNNAGAAASATAINAIIREIQNG